MASTSSGAPSLSELMGLAQKGDAGAYNQLLTRVADMLRAYFKRRVQDPGTVEDALQEALLSIHTARHTYRPEKRFEPWMYAIADHRLIDHLRKNRRYEATEDMDSLLLSDDWLVPGPDSALSSPSLEEILSALPQQQREVIRLLKIDELSVAEVSRKLGISESAVKVTAHRGYQILKKRFRGAEP